MGSHTLVHVRTTMEPTRSHQHSHAAAHQTLHSLPHTASHSASHTTSHTTLHTTSHATSQTIASSTAGTSSSAFSYPTRSSVPHSSGVFLGLGLTIAFLFGLLIFVSTWLIMIRRKIAREQKASEEEHALKILRSNYPTGGEGRSGRPLGQGNGTIDAVHTRVPTGWF